MFTLVTSAYIALFFRSLASASICADRRSRFSTCAVAGCVAMFSACLFPGCTTIVIPPLGPADPRPVFLLDHGRHSSLVVPRAEGGLVRYSYGDWEWYALVHTGPAQGTRAVFGPTPATLGRRELPGLANESNVRKTVLVPIEALFTVNVDASRIERLRRELDDIYRSQLSKLVYNPLYDLEFVPHPKPYSLNHNSNRVVADWLKELGCQVDSSPIFSRWTIGDER